MGKIHKATKKGDVEEVRRLLDEGVDVDLAGLAAFTPLHYAAIKGRTGVAALLIDRGADVNAPNGFGLTPLDCTFEWNSRAIKDMKVLLASRGTLRSSELEKMDQTEVIAYIIPVIKKSEATAVGHWSIAFTDRAAYFIKFPSGKSWTMVGSTISDAIYNVSARPSINRKQYINEILEHAATYHRITPENSANVSLRRGNR